MTAQYEDYLKLNPQSSLLSHSVIKTSTMALVTLVISSRGKYPNFAYREAEQLRLALALTRFTN